MLQQNKKHFDYSIVRVGEEHRLCPDPASKESGSWDQKGAVGHHKGLQAEPRLCVLGSRSRYSSPGLLK